MDINSNNISLSALQRELALFNNAYGWHEVIKNGALDTTDDWDETTSGTGFHTIYKDSIRLGTGSTLGSYAYLYRKMPIPYHIVGSGVDKIFERIILEFTCSISYGASADKDVFFMGFVNASNYQRNSDNVLGFGLNASSQIIAISRAGGSEELSTVTGLTLADKNKYKIVYDIDSTKFYVNEVLVGTHTTYTPEILLTKFITQNTDTNDVRQNLRSVKFWCD